MLATPAPTATSQQHRKSRTDDDPEPVDRDKIEAALDVISSDCSYAVWLKVAGALHHALGEFGFELFDRWSAKATGKAKDGTPTIHARQGQGTLARRAHSAGSSPRRRSSTWPTRPIPAGATGTTMRNGSATFAAHGAGAGARAVPARQAQAAGTGAAGARAARERRRRRCGATAVAAYPPRPTCGSTPPRYPLRDWLYGRLLIRQVRDRDRCPRRPRQIDADHRGDAGAGLGQGPARGHSSRAACASGSGIWKTRRRKPSARYRRRRKHYGLTRGGYRRPAVRGQRARPAARHRDHEPGRAP